MFTKIRQLALTLFCTALLSACLAPTAHILDANEDEINAEIRLQKEMVLAKAIEEDEHIQAIAYDILLKNADICKNTTLSAGFRFWNNDYFSGEHKEVAESLYQLDHVYKVQQVYNGTHAAELGIKRGDKVIAVNGEDVSTKATSTKVLTKALNKRKDKKIDILLLRGDKEIQHRIEPEHICDYGVIYDPTDLQVNAFADGYNIIMTRGMYRLSRDENDLAIVISHEIGHNIMKHSTKKDANSLWIKALGEAANLAMIITTPYKINQSYIDYAWLKTRNINSVHFEREADYIGLYMAERAGYDTTDSISFWRLMAVEHSGSNIDQRSTHPATAERFVYLQKTHEEINLKRNNNLPLIPNITEPDDADKFKSDFDFSAHHHD